MKITYRATLCAATAGIALLMAGTAQATPMVLIIEATDLTTNATVTQVYTDAGTPNTISVPSGSAGGIDFSGELSTSTIGGINTINTSALTVTNSSADPYSVKALVSGINFMGPATAVSVTGSGTWQTANGSFMTLQFYNDPNNVLTPDVNSPTGNAILPTPFVSTASGAINGSYDLASTLFTLANPDLGMFGMTETWTYDLIPGSQLISRGQTETSFNAPEPATLALLGSALTGLGIIRNRRNRKQN